MEEFSGKSGGSPNLGEAREHLMGDLETLRDVVTQRTEAIRSTVNGFVMEHPIAAVGAAVGVGYLLSGALYSRTTGRLFSFGTRFLLGALVKQVLGGGGLGAAVSSMAKPHQ